MQSRRGLGEGTNRTTTVQAGVIKQDRATAAGVPTRLSEVRQNTLAAPRPASGASRARTGTYSPRVDRRHARDPRYCTEYIQDILDSFREQETTFEKDPNYMTRQTELNEKMRLILVDWLVEVHLKFKLHQETFFLAVDILDRYLTKKTCHRTELQLLGITCTLLASKYEEIWPPEMKQCTYITANTYKEEEIVQMERSVMSALDFKLTVPTVHPFLTRFLDVIDAPEKLVFMAHYIAEAFMVDYQCLKFVPSVIAAASIYLAHLILRPAYPSFQDPWNSLLQHYTRYQEADLQECHDAMLSVLKFLPSSKYHAVRRKYSNKKYGEVSQIPIPENL